ncbi:hypothetical protein THAOC_28355 [Thalassiosira oceanica]|uniref:Uncharacterized protein n=1 Tax=Thalassiosira oceanica TaxID=159749 RepID=K0S0G8_THAOC|nr:hypothetical protein THAOC_28355 [Thalassiosira oceanica]|eukprot:EJK52377.1 hypothetical protein THAOC_28355 [Thalassiosira oceanica]
MVDGAFPPRVPPGERMTRPVLRTLPAGTFDRIAGGRGLGTPSSPAARPSSRRGRTFLEDVREFVRARRELSNGRRIVPGRPGDERREGASRRGRRPGGREARSWPGRPRKFLIATLQETGSRRGSGSTSGKGTARRSRDAARSRIRTAKAPSAEDGSLDRGQPPGGGSCANATTNCSNGGFRSAERVKHPKIVQSEPRPAEPSAWPGGLNYIPTEGLGGRRGGDGNIRVRARGPSGGSCRASPGAGDGARQGGSRTPLDVGFGRQRLPSPRSGSSGSPSDATIGRRNGIALHGKERGIQKLCSGARGRRSREATGAEGGVCTILALRGFAEEWR